MGLLGFSGNRGQQGSVGCAHLGPNRIGLGLLGPAPSFLLLFPLPSPFPPPEIRKGGGRIGGGPQVGFLLLGVPHGCSPSPPTYIYVGMGRLRTHTNNC